MPDTSSPESPIAFRVAWIILTADSAQPGKPKPQSANHRTRAAAEQQRAELRLRFGDRAIVSITPVWPRPIDPTTKAARRRAGDALGWPQQLTPKAAARAGERAARAAVKPLRSEKARRR